MAKQRKAENDSNIYENLPDSAFNRAAHRRTARLTEGPTESWEATEPDSMPTSETHPAPKSWLDKVGITRSNMERPAEREKPATGGALPRRETYHQKPATPFNEKELRRKAGTYSGMIIGTSELKDGRRVNPFFISSDRLADPNFDVTGELKRTMDWSPVDVAHKSTVIAVKAKPGQNDKRVIDDVIRTLSTRFGWQRNEEQAMRSNIKNGKIKIKMVSPDSQLRTDLRFNENVYNQRWANDNIFGKGRDPEQYSVSFLTKQARGNAERLPAEQLYNLAMRVDPEWANRQVRIHKGVDGFKSYLLKQNISVNRKEYENDPKTRMLVALIPDKELKTTHGGISAKPAVLGFDISNLNIKDLGGANPTEVEKAFSTPGERDSFLGKLRKVKPPMPDDAVKEWKDKQDLNALTKKLESNQKLRLLGAYSAMYVSGTDDLNVVVQHAQKNKQQFANFSQRFHESQEGQGVPKQILERTVKDITGLTPVYKDVKEMPEPPKQKATFIRGVAKELGMNESEFRRSPYYKLIYRQIRDGTISEEEIADVNLKESYGEWADFPMDYYALKEAAGVHKIKEGTLNKWPGGVPNAPDEISKGGGAGGGGGRGSGGSGRGPGRPSGSGGRGRFTKGEGIIHRPGGQLVSGGAPLFSRPEFIMNKSNTSYEKVTRKGRLSPFGSAEEKKAKFKAVQGNVQKMNDELTKKGLPGMTAKERARLENKWTESGREKTFEKIKQEKSKKLEKFQKYAGVAGGGEATRLALSKKEGGYGRLKSWWRTHGWGGAEGQRSDEWKHQKAIAIRTEKEGAWSAQAIKQTRIAEERKKTAASKWRSGWAGLKQGTKWALIIVCAVSLLFLPLGLFYVVGWAMAVALVTLIQFLVWVFISIWFVLAQGIVALIGGIGQLFIGAVNGLFGALTGWMGQPYQPLNWQWIQNMPMFKQDANGNWILLTYTDANGRRQMMTWGLANLVPPSFLKLDLFMPKTFDTNPIIAYIIPGLKEWFYWFYNPIAQMYTNWIQTQPWYIIGVTAGMPFVITIVVILLAYWYYRAKVKPRMY